MKIRTRSCSVQALSFILLQCHNAPTDTPTAIVHVHSVCSLSGLWFWFHVFNRDTTDMGQRSQCVWHKFDKKRLRSLGRRGFRAPFSPFLH